jgi:hypothetical protein
MLAAEPYRHFNRSGGSQSIIRWWRSNRALRRLPDPAVLGLLETSRGLGCGVLLFSVQFTTVEIEPEMR